jgi:hypothetical protein
MERWVLGTSPRMTKGVALLALVRERKRARAVLSRPFPASSDARA